MIDPLRHVLLPLLSVPLLLSAQAAQPECVTAEFTAEVSFGTEDAPTLSFSGGLTLCDSRLRIDAQDALTQEPLVVLADADAKELTLLYPDTLNGRRFQLAEGAESAQLSMVYEAITAGRVEPPDNWQIDELPPQEIDGVRCAHYRTEPAEGVSIDWWTGPDERPAKVVARRDEVRVTVRISAYEAGAACDPQLFAVGHDYTISEGRGPVAEQLPPL